MKKVFAILVFIIFAGTAAFSQVQDHALGLRLGGGDAFGTEVSYQHGLSSATRLEADLGFYTSSDVNKMRLTVLHQWVWDIQGGLKWYAGLGGGFGHASKSSNDTNEFILDVDGNVGLEYQLDIPLQLTLDFRPAFGTSDFSGSSVGIGIRYTF